MGGCPADMEMGGCPAEMGGCPAEMWVGVPLGVPMGVPLIWVNSGNQ